jgi:DNA-binding transcriptional MocR family regulator
VAADAISFARGAPSADILPRELVREAAARALESDWERALSYGTGRGHPRLCEWVANLHGVDLDQVMVTNGSLEGGALLFEHLVGPGDRVIVEQPSYDRTLLLLKRRGATLTGVPLDADGINVGYLEETLEVGAGPKLVHIIPSFHNPAGCTLSDAKRHRLIELAADYELRILEDDPYAEIYFHHDEPVPTMLSIDEGGRIVYASSFSKTVSPGVRVGYLVGPAAEIAALAKRANETYISPNMLAEAIVYELCRSGGLAENINMVRHSLRERRDALVDSLRELIPEADFVVPEGGYFLWLTLGGDVDCAELLPVAKEEGVVFIPGADFMLEGGRASLRLSFASVPVERIGEGVARLGRALDRVRSAALT